MLPVACEGFKTQGIRSGGGMPVFPGGCVEGNRQTMALTDLPRDPNDGLGLLGKSDVAPLSENPQTEGEGSTCAAAGTLARR